MKSLFFILISMCCIQLSAQKIHLSLGGTQFFSNTNYSNRSGIYVEPGFQISKRLMPTFSFNAFKLMHETEFTPSMILYSGKFQIPVDTIYNVKDDYKKSLYNFQFKFKYFMAHNDRYKLYVSPTLGATNFIDKHTRQHDDNVKSSGKSITTHFNFGTDLGLQYALVKEKDIYLDVSASYNCLRNRDANLNYQFNGSTPFTNLYNSTWQFRVGISAMLWKISEI